MKKGTLARRCGTCDKYFPIVDDDKESADLGLHEDASEEEDAPVFRNIFEIMRWPLILYECIFVSIFIVINCLVVSMQNMPL